MTPEQRAQCADALAAVESPQQLRDRAHRLYELAQEMHNRGDFIEHRDCLTAAAALHALAVMWERQVQMHGRDYPLTETPHWVVQVDGELQWAWTFEHGGPLPDALAAVVRDE
jgi:hypothetical protein